MKKAIVGLLLVICLLTACSKEAKPEVTTEDPQLAVTTTATTEISTDSVETEIPTTEEQPSTALETSEIVTEVTTESTEPLTEGNVPTETPTENKTQPTTVPTETTAQPTTTPPTTIPPTTTSPTEPPTTEPPAPTETQPPETEPPTTEAPKEVIDLSALEEYGRAYARTLGYNGNPNTGFATSAGYFPPSYVFIRSMEEGYRHVKEAVEAQYINDVSAGHDIVVVIDGVERHRKLNIYIEETGEPDWYLVYCFYGGE